MTERARGRPRGGLGVSPGGAGACELRQERPEDLLLFLIKRDHGPAVGEGVEELDDAELAVVIADLANRVEALEQR